MLSSKSTALSAYPFFARTKTDTALPYMVNSVFFSESRLTRKSKLRFAEADNLRLAIETLYIYCTASSLGRIFMPLASAFLMSFTSSAIRLSM